MVFGFGCVVVINGLCEVMVDDCCDDDICGLDGKIYIVVCALYITDVVRRYCRPAGGIFYGLKI